MSLGLLTRFGITSGSAAPAFSPDDIAGLLLWLDADDASTITDTGGAVSQWDDKSANANHVTQATGSLQPTTGSVTINGKNAISFADDVLTLNSTIAFNAQNRTFFFVIDFNTEINAASGQQWFLTHYPNAINGHALTWFGSFSGAWTDETWAYWQRDGSSQNRGYAVKDTIATGAHVFRQSSDSTMATVEMALDGTSLTKFVSSQGAFSTAQTAVVRSIGYSANATFRLAELLIYDSVLGASDIADVESYLAAKWGITI